MTNPDRTPVAQEIFTYCTKEKHETWHVVMYHNAQGFVEKVKCKACKSEHKYQSSKPSIVKSGAGKKTVVRKTSSASTPGNPPKLSSFSDATWFVAVKNWGDKPIPAFNPTTHYANGDIFAHPVFGKGVVKLRRENKIEVLFQSGVKVLPSPKNA